MNNPINPFFKGRLIKTTDLFPDATPIPKNKRSDFVDMEDYRFHGNAKVQQLLHSKN